MEYRKDIDGLRAVAVLPVILFHAGFEVFKGGFLGVDVFFVISGFLISSIILEELQQEKFSIVNFYERRARRILPALFSVLTCTYLVSFVFMPPFEFKEFSQSLVSVAVFLSNIFFYLEIDYFSLMAEEMPLLHTWSLAIEEQFYIFFPPTLFVIWRLGARRTLIILSFFTITSVVVMMALNHSKNPSASFYWPISRAWELLAGSICALLIRQGKIPEVRYLSDIGLFVLTVCLFVWSKAFVHPSVFTIIPVLATCLIIVFPQPRSISFELLSNNKIVFIGLISYSLYLWHQPILAFLRMKSLGNLNVTFIVAALIITFIISYLSYRYIETPFRNRKKFSRKFIFSSSVVGLFCFLIIGLHGHFGEGIHERFVFLKSYSDSIEHSPKRGVCHANKTRYLRPDDVCVYFDGNPSWAVFGDSHVVEPAYALAQLLTLKNIALSHHSFSGCPPALNYQQLGNELCTKWLNEHLDYLESNKSIKTVLVGFRYSSAIYGDNVAVYPDVPSEVLLNNIVPYADYSDQEKLDLYWNSLEEIIVRLLASGKRVLLLEPIPELPMHIGRGVTSFSIFGNSTLLDLTTATPKEYYFQRHEFILSRLRALPPNENLMLIDVYDLLCHDKGCPAVINESAIYFDDDHLSVIGSQILFERLQRKIEFY